MDDPEFHRRLRRLIGRRCILPDGEWQILEVLEHDAGLVLQSLSDRRGTIQADAFGNPSRRAPVTRTLPILDDEGNLSDDILVLLRNLRSHG